jgi:integrase/recombinase XerC
MLHRHISPFLDYCQLANFSARSIQTLTARINEFKTYLKSQKIRSIKKVTYQHLINFIADFKSPSIHVRKSRGCSSGSFAGYGLRSTFQDRLNPYGLWGLHSFVIRKG